MRDLLVVGACTVVAALCASSVWAQGVDAGRFEIAAGVMWVGATSFGTVAATEAAPTGRFTLFSTSTELAAALGVEARVGVRLTPVLQVEASSSYGRPQLRTAVSGDVENGAPITAFEAVQQFTVDGALVLHLTHWRIGTRAVPFVLAGAGYLRELHEGNTLAVTGQTFFAGGGVKYLLVSRPHGLKGIGVRADARALMRRKGVAFDTRVRTSPALGASLFVTF